MECIIKKFKLQDEKELTSPNISEALLLVWEVFCQFDAPDYPKEGVREFRETLDDPVRIGGMIFYGAYWNNELVGVLAMREPQHVSFFFVKSKYHRKGIGRQLFDTMREDYILQDFTVNSAPYAVEIYRHLGFEATDKQQEVNGIRYTPMKYSEK